MKVGTTTVPPGLIQSSTPTELVFKVPLGAVTAKISMTTVDGTTTSANTLTGAATAAGDGLQPESCTGGSDGDDHRDEPAERELW